MDLRSFHGCDPLLAMAVDKSMVAHRLIMSIHRKSFRFAYQRTIEGLMHPYQEEVKLEVCVKILIAFPSQHQCLICGHPYNVQRPCNEAVNRLIDHKLHSVYRARLV